MGVIRIVGLGNEWAGDDAVGLIAAQRLRERCIPGVEVSTRDVPDWEMFEHLQAEDLLIFIDACQSGAEPGTIVELHADDAMGQGVRHCSSHGLGLTHWLSMADVLGTKTGRVIICGIEIAQTEMGAGLSKPVTAAVADVCDRIAETVAGYTERAHA